MEKRVKLSTADFSDGNRAFGLVVWKDENDALGYEIIGIQSGYVKGELVNTRTVERPATLEEAKNAAESSLCSYLKKQDLKIVWKDLV